MSSYVRSRYKGVNTFHHVIMRGGRGMNIVEDDHDRWDFLRLLFYLNDVFRYKHWSRELRFFNCSLFDRPHHWPARDPLVKILAFCLHNNHFHLLVKEIRDGGLSEFMQRLPNSMSLRYNKRYGGKGSIFQASYQYRRIDLDADLMIVALYIMAKNTFEKYPDGGLKAASDNFEAVYGWALKDPFSSFADYAGKRGSPILDKDILSLFFDTPAKFKREARDYIKWRREREVGLGELVLE